MKKYLGLAGTILIMLVIGSANLAAQTIQGEVVEIDPQGAFLKVARSDPEAGSVEPESIKVYVTEESQFEGVSLENLRVRDEIWADVVESNVQGAWLAKRIELDKVNIRTHSDLAARFV